MDIAVSQSHPLGAGMHQERLSESIDDSNVWEDTRKQKVVVALEIVALFICTPLIECLDKRGVLADSCLHTTHQKIEDISHQKELRSLEPLQKRDKLLP